MKDCGLVIPVVYLKNIFPNKGRNIFIIMFKLSSTQITIAITVVIAIGNALVPFMSPQFSGIVVTVLGLLASYFHVSDTKAAVLAAKAPQV